MISIELCHVIWKFIEGSTSFGELWDEGTPLTASYSVDCEEADIFDAVCMCQVHIADGVWSEDEAREWLRTEMRKYPTVYAEWRGP